MRGAMKTITPHFVSPVQLIWQSIQISMIRQCLMKSSVEDSDLRQPFAKQAAGGSDTFDVGGIVQWRQVDAILYTAKHFICNQDRMGELLASVDDAMAHRLNISNALNLWQTGLCRRCPPDDEVHGAFNIPQRFG